MGVIFVKKACAVSRTLIVLLIVSTQPAAVEVNVYFMVCNPIPATAGEKMPPGVTPGPEKTPVPGTPPISVACVIWNGKARKQVSGILLNCTFGAALTIITCVKSLKHKVPEKALKRIV
jgi:hypothetical protein